ncbi:Calcium-transporting ATPase 12, plasma membrane-type [Sesbania bispinosa]|nr:Calcium-transporting ATPase 12, plasma membrane-type [Sesbania bispinosa]
MRVTVICTDKIGTLTLDQMRGNKEGDQQHSSRALKGPAEMILAMCSNYIDCNGTSKSLDEEQSKLEKIIQGVAASFHHS